MHTLRSPKIKVFTFERETSKNAKLFSMRSHGTQLISPLMPRLHMQV